MTSPVPDVLSRPSAVVAEDPAPAAPSLRDRLLGVSRPASGPWAWAAILLVTVIGGVLRFWHLDRPRELVFDETYYVKQGAAYLKSGHELRWNADATPKPDDLFASGTTDVFLDEPDFVVHPPVGKWMIAAGEWLLGADNPWGWRFASALVGTLSILMVALIARRLFRSTLLGVVAGLLLAVEGHHFVHSRTGLLDVFLMFWVLAAFGCLLLDRDDGRERLAARVTAGASLDGLGPRLGIRWWRLAAALCLGLATATKWSGLYAVAILGLTAVLWDVGARRAAGVRRWWAGGLVKDGLPAAVTVLPIVVVTYLASWTGWFLSDDGWGRNWARENPSAAFGWVPDGLRSLWNYHAQMYQFHVSLSSPHPYQANPWSWLIMGRPTAFHYDGDRTGCGADQCSQAITAIGNPVVWWGGVIAIGVLLFCWALRRDWRAGAILSGIAAGYLPWFAYQDRTIYMFYAVVFTPFLVLGVTYVIGLLLGRPGTTGRRRAAGALTAGGLVLLAVLLFWFFLPVLNGELIPQPEWRDRMWFPSWI